MELLISFKNSLLLPRREALFRLNRISMRNTIAYIFTLMFLLYIPEIVSTILERKDLPEGVMPSLYVLQLVVFYPFVILFLGITLVSILAFFALFLKQILRRKLKYQQLWKMTAFTMTLPLIIYTFLRLVGLDNFLLTILLMVIFYYLLYKMIIIYPAINRN